MTEHAAGPKLPAPPASLGSRIRPYDDLAEVARHTAPWLRSGSVALSGGATFGSLYPLWLSLRQDFSLTTFFPVDERIVPFESPDSNWGTAYRRFLSLIGREQDKVHHPASASEYLVALRRHFGVMPPRFDAILLGAGEDGHTASLFPGDACLKDMSTVVMQTRSPKPPHERITLGPIVLSRAARLVAIVHGAGKAPVVRGIRRQDRSLPVVDVLARHPSPEVWIHRPLLREAM